MFGKKQKIIDELGYELQQCEAECSDMMDKNDELIDLVKEMMQEVKFGKNRFQYFQEKFSMIVGEEYERLS